MATTTERKHLPDTDAPRDRSRLEEQELRNAFQEQQRIDRIQQKTAVERHKDQLVQSLIEGVVVLGLAEFLIYGLSFWSLPLLAVLGAGAGFLAHHVNAQRGLACGIAFVAMGLVRLLVGFGNPYHAILYFIIGTCLFVGARIPRASERIGW